MLFCDHCGAENDDTATTCVFCQELLIRVISSSPTLQAQHQIQISRPRSPHTTISANTSSSLAPNARLHQRYRIIERVGEGGYAAIYKAFDRQNKHRLVAIKTINLKGLSAEEMIDATATFNSEVAILSTLHHPALPQLHDHFTDSEHWYLVMDFIEGQTLEQHFASLTHTDFDNPQKIHDFIQIAIELCDVLTYLHNKRPRIIYRDLKPANIIIKKDKHIALIDFGTARYFKRGQARDTIPLGSPGYASPEQYGKAQTTPKSDIYSLGALLHQMLTGKDPANHPFHFPPLTALAPGLPPELAEYVMRMLSLDTSKRPASTYEVKLHLTSALETLKANTRLTNSSSSPTKHTKVGRRQALFWGGIAIATAGVAIYSTSILGHSKTTTNVVSTTTPATSSMVIPEVTPDDNIPSTPYLTHITPIATWALPDRATAFTDTEDSAFSIAACMDNNIYVFYTNHTVTYSGHNNGGYSWPIKYLTHAYEDNYSASCADGDSTIHIWDTTTGNLYHKVNVPSTVTALSLLRENLAVACNDVVYTYDLSHINPREEQVTLTPKRIYHENGTTINTLKLQIPEDSTLYLCYGCENGSVNVWKDDRLAIKYQHSGPVNALDCWNTCIATGSSDHMVQVYDITNGAFVTQYSGHARQKQAVKKVTWLTYDALATLDESGMVHIWNIPLNTPSIEEPLLTTRADPRFEMNSYIVQSDYYLTCITSPQAYTVYKIS